MFLRALRRTAIVVGAVGAVQVVRFSTLEKSETHTTETALTQFFLFDALRVVSQIARRKHDSDCAAFDTVQADLLRSRLAANAETAYGCDHGFAKLLQHSGGAELVAAFRTSQPLTYASHYTSYVERIAAGESAVMNAEPETMLAATSGTSGRRNIIPNTPTMSSTFFTKGILVIFDTLRKTCPDAFMLQRTCKLAFAPMWQPTAGGLRVGPNSSGPKDKSFKRLLPLYSTPEEGYTIAHDEFAALYVHALFAARDRKLGIIEANFISMPCRLLSLIHRDGLRLAADLETGKIDSGVAARLEPATLHALEQHLGGPDPARAAEIRAAVEADGGAREGLARRIWPDLRLFLANGTGAFASYAARLRSGEGWGVPVLSTVLAASEGLMGVSLADAGSQHNPSEDGDSVFCLVPRAMFFEFKPLREEGSSDDGPEHSGTLLPHECTVGSDYELVVTNLGGLYRYRIGDVVRLEGFHQRAPLVRFRYRLGQLLNLRGEKVSEPQLENALHAALRPAEPPAPRAAPRGASMAEYAVQEDCDVEPPRYRVFVEPEKGSARADEALSDRLDEALKRENPVYATWRRKGAIGRAEVCMVGPGAISEELRARRLAEGASPQQLKVSRVLREGAHAAMLRQRALQFSRA